MTTEIKFNNQTISIHREATSQSNLEPLAKQLNLGATSFASNNLQLIDQEDHTEITSTLPLRSPKKLTNGNPIKTILENGQTATFCCGIEVRRIN